MAHQFKYIRTNSSTKYDTLPRHIKKRVFDGVICYPFPSDSCFLGGLLFAGHTPGLLIQ